MANAFKVQKLKQKLATITQYDGKKLKRRSEWGAITFDSVAQEIDDTLFVALDLLKGPLEHISDQTVEDINGALAGVATYLEQIDNFDLKGNAQHNRDDIEANLKTAAAHLQAVAMPSIAYLAYRRGRSDENTKELEQLTENARDLFERTLKYTDEKQRELNAIADAFRMGSGSVGVGKFEGQFDGEARKLTTGSRLWLVSTAVMAIITVLTAAWSFLGTSLPDDANSWTILHHVVTRVSVIAILFAGTVWCSRIYRAIRHQASVNRHRALSLQTFATFVEATDDPATRDAVLMAATRSIFANVPTGLVDERSASKDTSVNVLEIGKSAGKALRPT